VAAPYRFYVYALTDETNAVVYVGKGSGYRLTVQRYRFKCAGHEIARFKREDDAYAFEREKIAEIKPRLNRHPGGNGSRATPIKPEPRIHFDMRSRYPLVQCLFDLCEARSTRDARKFNEVMQSTAGISFPWYAPQPVKDLWFWFQENQAVRI
jgi:hypothetical protein